VRSTAPSNVSVIGWAKAEDVFGVSDIILSTSRNEGMPVALIEAQLAGKAVVANDVGSVSEVIVDGKSGYLVCGDPQHIVLKIQSLLSNPKELHRFEMHAQKTSSMLFGVDTLVTKHIKLYKSLV
jgi:glycosyltransferase involved in cell wall biosynthesis